MSGVGRRRRRKRELAVLVTTACGWRDIQVITALDLFLPDRNLWRSIVPLQLACFAADGEDIMRILITTRSRFSTCVVSHGREDAVLICLPVCSFSRVSCSICVCSRKRSLFSYYLVPHFTPTAVWPWPSCSALHSAWRSVVAGWWLVLQSNENRHFTAVLCLLLAFAG